MQSRRGVRGGSKLNEKSMQRGCVPVYGCKSSKSDAGRERERSIRWTVLVSADASRSRDEKDRRAKAAARGGGGVDGLSRDKNPAAMQIPQR